MPRAVMTVLSRPSSPEREDEYHRWYDGTHLREVCAVPGVTGARRFHLPGQDQYLAIYEIDAADPEAVVQAIAAGAMNGSIQMSDALCMDPPPSMQLNIERCSYP